MFNGIVFLVTALLVSPVFAQEEVDLVLQKAFSNAAHENIECFAYYKIVAEALRRDEKGSVTAASYEAAAESLLDRSLLLTDHAGMLLETISARVDMALIDMNKRMANNMANISILMAECPSSYKLEQSPA